MDKPALVVVAVQASPPNVAVLRAVVPLEGLELLVADDAQQALALSTSRDPVLVLVQVQGNEASATLAESLRGDERTRDIPIYFITAGPGPELLGFRGFELAAVDYVPEPLEPRLLRSKLHLLAELRRQRLQHEQRAADHERLQRLTAMMLAALSHDMRTPLTVLALNAEMLIRRNDTAGERIKNATLTLGRQVEHLVNLTQLPGPALQPCLRPGHLGALLKERLADASNQALRTGACRLDILGNDEALFDAGMLTDAIDQLLLQASLRANGAPMDLTVDGRGRHTVVVRLHFDTVLDDPARMHLFGGAMRMEGVPSTHVGPGLQQAERVLRAHAGSLIGRSKEREGTTLELMLPRAPLG